MKGQAAAIGIIEPDPWPFDGCKRRAAVTDEDSPGRVVRKVGWHRCMKCRRPFFSEDVLRLSPGHVEALNAIPVEFYGRSKKLKPIVDDWHTYLDTLENKGNWEGQVLAVARQNAFMDMLHKISIYLGYSFNRSELEKDVYYPEGHKVIEDDQELIRRGFAAMFKGELAIPMAVKEFPATVDEQTFDNQAALTKLLTEWLEGQRTVKVKQSEGDDHNGEA